MRRFYVRSMGVGLLALVGMLTAPSSASAQYLGHNFHGDFGVNSGSQPGPGFYVSIPFAQWNADNLRDADGDPFAADQFQGFDVRAVPTTFIVVTPAKLLGANYGFMVATPFSTIWPERASLQENDADWGFHDLYVVPLHLGWHTPRADFVVSYGFFAPTGRYEAGATDNVGLGMWSQEFQAGTTMFLDPGRRFSAATTAFFETHSSKEDLDLKVGNLLTLEGGFAYNVPAIGGAFGVGYYLQQKLSNDSGTDLPALALAALNLRGKNRLFGIGPDVTMAIFQRGGTIGLVNVRYLWESGGKSSFQGNTFLVGLTIARPNQ